MSKWDPILNPLALATQPTTSQEGNQSETPISSIAATPTPPTLSEDLREAFDGKARERLQAYVDWAEADDDSKCPGIVPDDVARLLAALAQVKAS